MIPERRTIIDIVVGFFIFIAIICCIFGFIKSCIFHKDKNDIQIEDTEIDSLNKDNNNLIIEVEHLDSIKNDKINKVKSLDNDSTLKLFYKLIGK